jgi:DNA primase
MPTQESVASGRTVAVPFSHPDRVIYPALEIFKLEHARYMSSADGIGRP